MSIQEVPCLALVESYHIWKVCNMRCFRNRNKQKEPCILVFYRNVRTERPVLFSKPSFVMLQEYTTDGLHNFSYIKTKIELKPKLLNTDARDRGTIELYRRLQRYRNTTSHIQLNVPV